jgi:RHS repeat-associated protein
MTGYGTASYVYDAENRLIATAGYSYIYDGDGQRVEKCTEGATPGACASGATGTLYWRGLSSDALSETDLAGTVQNTYVFFGGQRVARRDSAGAIHYYFSDHLGSHGVVENATGTACEQDIDYYPYGGAENDYCNSTSVPQNYKFTGKERDSESGLDYFGARHNTSILGRFMTPDPLLSSGRPGSPQSWNRYAYVQNNPLGRIDPSGLYDFKNTCSSSDKACNAAFTQTQTNVRNMYAATQAAYDKAVKNGDTKAATALKRTLDGLGAEGQKNARGQTVNISADPTLLSPGQTSFAKGSTSTINIVLNPTHSNGPEDAEAEAGHEGVHGGEIMPGKPTWAQAYSDEHDAYETESYFSQSIGFSDTRSFGEGDDMSKNYTLWSPSWAAADVETRRSHGVDASAKAGADQDCANGGCKK